MFQDKLRIMQLYMKDKNLKISNDSLYDFSSVNRLFVSPKQEIRECMKDLFEDEITLADFEADPSRAARLINKWVETNTRNQIKDLIKGGLLTKYTQLVLVSFYISFSILNLYFHTSTVSLCIKL